MADDLERRAIIAAHDAGCLMQGCGDDVSTYPPLSKREQAIVALWRADRAEKSAEVDDKSRLGHAAADAWMDKANEAEAAIERARQAVTVFCHGEQAYAEHGHYCIPILNALDGAEATP